jgi:hypothetical protein
MAVGEAAAVDEDAREFRFEGTAEGGRGMFAVKLNLVFSWARISAVVVGMKGFVPGLGFEDSASLDESWRGIMSRSLPLRSALEVFVGDLGTG